MFKKFSALLIGLLLFSVFATGVHHHDDNGAHVDCSICIVSTHTPAVSDNNINLVHRELVLPFKAPGKTFYLSLPEEPSSPSRAPPAATVLS